MTILLCAAPSSAEDVVYLAGSSGSGEVRYQGEIVDYNGREIRLRTSAGERSYPADRVLRIESQWLPEQTAADAAFAEGDYRQAVNQYTAASRREPRTWVRRKILAQLVWCYRATDQVETACDTFLLLARSDPATPYLDAIPLAWMPSERVNRKKAEDWLARGDLPAAVLLGASHLMSTDRRPAALAALQSLSTNEDARIAALAESQSWRPLVVRASPQQLAGWSAMVEKMPQSVRAGPYFLLGRTYAAHGRHEEAALAFLRTVILFPREKHLAAASLLAAGDSLVAINQIDDATRLYREVANGHAEGRWQQEAQTRLDGLTDQKRE